MTGETIVVIDERPLRRSFLSAFLEKNLDADFISGANLDDVRDQLELETALATNGPKVVSSPGGLETSVREPSIILINFGGEPIEEAGPTSVIIHSAVDRFPDTAVVIMSDVDSRPAVLSAFRLGAQGYLTTSMEEGVMLATLKLIQAGGQYAPTDILLMDNGKEGGGGDVPPTKSFAEVANGRAQVGDPRLEQEEPFEEDLTECEEVSLSPRESQVLAEIRRGMQNKQIAYELAMSESTVKVHVRNIMKKLDVKNRTQAAIRARQLNLPVTVEAIQTIAVPQSRRPERYSVAGK